MRMRRLIVVCCLLLAACQTGSAPRTASSGSRLPTRLPTPVPTPTPFSVSAEAYYEQGVERQRRGNMDDAEQYLSWAIERDPDFAPAYVSRGGIHLSRGDLDRALADVDAALEIEPTARSYVLRGEVLRRREAYGEALRAFDAALARDASLEEQTFQSRWAAAQAAEDEVYLSALASEYAAAHPGDWMGYYYRAWASFASEAYDGAIALLVEGIEESGRQPALLWYLLGRSYIEIEAWPEAIVSLEAARTLLESDDLSMTVHTDRPVADLFVALGRAYLGAGRCADAETMLAYGLSVGASMAEHLPALEEARICQTPSPESAPGTPVSGQ